MASFWDLCICQVPSELGWNRKKVGVVEPKIALIIGLWHFIGIQVIFFLWYLQSVKLGRSAPKENNYSFLILATEAWLLKIIEIKLESDFVHLMTGSSSNRLLSVPVSLLDQKPVALRPEKHLPVLLSRGCLGPGQLLLLLLLLLTTL